MTAIRPTRLSLLDVATIVLTVVIATVAMWIAVYGPSGPVPVHFGINGQPDRWGSRFEIVGVIGLMGLMAGLIGGGFGVVAARTDEPARRRSMRIGQFVVLVATGLASLLIVRSSLAMDADTASPITGAPGIMSLILLLVGAVLGRVSPNPFVGVRTPWNYKSRLAWDRSNRLGGRLLFWTGLAGLAMTPLLPMAWTTTVLVILILGTTALTLFESWRVWRDDPDRQPF